MGYYISVLAVYMVFYALGAWTLNLQFGMGGIINFGLIIFEAAGAYAAVLTSIGRSGLALGETYIWGVTWPFPLPLLAGGVAGGALALLIGPAMMRRMRADYQAAGTLVIAIIASQLITTDPKLLNGANGLSGAPQPFSQYFTNPATYQWVFFVGSAVIALACLFVMQRVSRSPFGRTMRAVRDNEAAAAALGKNAWATRMIVFVLGGAILGIVGALTVEFITAWSPAAWGYQESFDLLVAIFLGGLASQLGAFIGSFIIGVVLLRLSVFMPQIGYPGLVDSLVWILIGLVWVVMLWFRPQGLVPAQPALRLADTAGVRPYFRSVLARLTRKEYPQAEFTGTVVK